MLDKLSLRGFDKLRDHTGFSGIFGREHSRIKISLERTEASKVLSIGKGLGGEGWAVERRRLTGGGPAVEDSETKELGFEAMGSHLGS